MSKKKKEEKAALPLVMKTTNPNEIYVPALDKYFQVVHLRNESVTLKPGDSWTLKPTTEAVIYLLWADPSTVGAFRFKINEDVYTHSAEALAFLKPPEQMMKLLDVYVAAVLNNTAETEVQYIAADLTKEHSAPLAEAIRSWLTRVGLSMDLHVRAEDTVSADPSNAGPLYFNAIIKEPVK